MNLYLVTTKHIGHDSWALARADSGSEAMDLVRAKSDALCDCRCLEAAGTEYPENYDIMATLPPEHFLGLLTKPKEVVRYIISVDILVDTDDRLTAQRHVKELLAPAAACLDYRIRSTSSVASLPDLNPGMVMG